MNGLTFSQKYWESDFYCCCSSVAQFCLTLCDLMDCITLGLPLILFSFCPLFFPSIRDFSNESFASDDQNTGVSASTSVLPVNIQHWYPLWLAGLISLLSKKLSGVFSRTRVWRHQFFSAMHSLWSNSHNCT